MCRCLMVILFFVGLYGCTKDPQYIQTSQVDPDLYLVETDTVLPQFTVYRLDSFATSGNNRVIVGAHNDPYFGKTTSRSFARFKIASNGYESVGLNSESYDSIVLVMKTDHSYYGDTLSDLNISVNPLNADLNAPNGNYYNNQFIPTTDEELANLHIRVRPNIDDSVRIRLADNFGSAIFDLYKTRNASIITQDEFQRYFKGLSISAASSGNVIYGFNAADSATYIRLYYHDDQGVIVNKNIDFGSEGGAYQFNEISYDPQGTVLENLLPGKEMNSAQLNHQIYVNDMAGIGSKITFPSLPTLQTVDNFVRIVNGQLKIRPVSQSMTGHPPIKYISMGVQSAQNTTIVPLSVDGGSGPQTGDLNIDNLNGIGTAYQYDLSALLRVEIASTVYNTNTLWLQPFTTTGTRVFSLDRLVAADATYVKMPSSLTLQLLFYKQ